MMVFWKAGLVFLSVPKTGTTAWQSTLGDRADIIVRDPPILKHTPLYRYNRFFRPLFEKGGAIHMDILAVVREPVSWLGSWYRYRQRPFMEGHKNSTHDISFDDFVREYCTEKPASFANIGSQARFLAPLKNGLHITHLFRYEAPEALNAFLTERLGDIPATQRLNVSPDGDLTLSADVAQQFREKHPDEFTCWEQAHGEWP